MNIMNAITAYPLVWFALGVIGTSGLAIILLEPMETDEDLSFREKTLGYYSHLGWFGAFASKLSIFASSGRFNSVIAFAMVAATIFGYSMGVNSMLHDPNILQTL